MNYVNMAPAERLITAATFSIFAFGGYYADGLVQLDFYIIVGLLYYHKILFTTSFNLNNAYLFAASCHFHLTIL